MEKQLEEQVATLKQLQEELAEVKEQHANKNSGGDPSALTNEKKMSISLETARRAADFSRRMPNACINLLKSHQVATAEEQAGGSWRIYAANLKRLSADGV